MTLSIKKEGFCYCVEFIDEDPDFCCKYCESSIDLNKDVKNSDSDKIVDLNFPLIFEEDSTGKELKLMGIVDCTPEKIKQLESIGYRFKSLYNYVDADKLIEKYTKAVRYAEERVQKEKKEALEKSKREFQQKQEELEELKLKINSLSQFV